MTTGYRAVLAWAPALAGLALGVPALGPALGPGFALRYDMLFVPDPPLRGPGGGFPRAVPSDQVVAALSAVAPADLVQKAILLGIFVLAATGAAALVGGTDARGGRIGGTAGGGGRMGGTAGGGAAGRHAVRLCAAVFYAWNLYLAQRLLLGQWALLLGYAGLPWAVRAASRGDGVRGTARLALALLPAAIGGFQAMLVSALAVLPVSGRRFPRALAVLALLALPWAVPALAVTGVRGDPAGVHAFAARADGPFGTLGSLLSLGGVWNAGAGVPGQGDAWFAAVRLALAAFAVAGFFALSRRGRPPYWTGLLCGAAAGLAVACAGAFAPGALGALVGLWPGFGPLRDGQAYLAPLALLQAVGFAAALAYLTGSADVFGRRVILAVGVVVPVLVLPTFALGAFGRLTAVPYPADWRAAQAVVNADPAPGALVSLPWSAYRAPAWNGGRTVLDPAAKMFSRPVVRDDGLGVGSATGTVRVAGEDPVARRVGALITGPGPLDRRLAAEGVRYVLIEAAHKNVFLPRFPGARPVVDGPWVVLLRL
ncbi:hypothetical protein [Spongiactinospora sp. TRM90649]|uniref:hypothetical protein n=1 Tax=Spongiactinospora sp. TRM90649 TaxID=3031114 RepID=UPI0023F74368|nr:hypothetical protein [Spongiactinospora sp. TRM90649]MDF5751062.1 hypothetical protein [Spongiactinospora sp. TRM90649]